jgi:hypothetical protein
MKADDSFLRWAKESDLDVDRFAWTVYRMSNEMQRDFEAWSKKTGCRNKGRFWMAQCETFLQRRERKLKESTFER